VPFALDPKFFRPRLWRVFVAPIEKQTHEVNVSRPAKMPMSQIAAIMEHEMIFFSCFRRPAGLGTRRFLITNTIQP
jgi:hypothetical protein